MYPATVYNIIDNQIWSRNQYKIEYQKLWTPQFDSYK